MKEIKLHSCKKLKRDSVAVSCTVFSTLLSLGLIENFTMDNLRAPPENFHKVYQPLVFAAPPLQSLLFYRCSFTKVLWPSLELNELSLITVIKGISGVGFGCGVCLSYRLCGGDSSSQSSSPYPTLCYRGDIM